MKSTHFGALAFAAAALACGSGSSSSTNGGAGGNASGGSSAAGGRNGTAGSSNGGVNSTGGSATAGAAGTTSNGGGGGTAACAGAECTGFPPTFVRACTNDASCVGEVHQTDCCGSLRVMGMNHSEAGTFCSAESGANGCRSQYPNPAGCTSNSVQTDSGPAPSLDDVATQCANIVQGVGTCTTYVCGTTGTPTCPSNRDIGNCGP